MDDLYAGYFDTPPDEPTPAEIAERAAVERQLHFARKLKERPPHQEPYEVEEIKIGELKEDD